MKTISHPVNASLAERLDALRAAQSGGHITPCRQTKSKATAHARQCIEEESGRGGHRFNIRMTTGHCICGKECDQAEVWTVTGGLYYETCVNICEQCGKE